MLVDKSWYGQHWFQVYSPLGRCSFTSCLHSTSLGWWGKGESLYDLILKVRFRWNATWDLTDASGPCWSEKHEYIKSVFRIIWALSSAVGIKWYHFPEKSWFICRECAGHIWYLAVQLIQKNYKFFFCPSFPVWFFPQFYGVLAQAYQAQ